MIATTINSRLAIPVAAVTFVRPFLAVGTFDFMWGSTGVPKTGRVVQCGVLKARNGQLKFISGAGFVDFCTVFFIFSECHPPVENACPTEA